MAKKMTAAERKAAKKGRIKNPGTGNSNTVRKADSTGKTNQSESGKTRRNPTTGKIEPKAAADKRLPVTQGGKEVAKTTGRAVATRGNTLPATTSSASSLPATRGGSAVGRVAGAVGRGVARASGPLALAAGVASQLVDENSAEGKAKTQAMKDRNRDEIYEGRARRNKDTASRLGPQYSHDDKINNKPKTEQMKKSAPPVPKSKPKAPSKTLKNDSTMEDKKSMKEKTLASATKKAAPKTDSVMEDKKSNRKYETKTPTVFGIPLKVTKDREQSRNPAESRMFGRER